MQRYQPPHARQGQRNGQVPTHSRSVVHNEHQAIGANTNTDTDGNLHGGRYNDGMGSNNYVDPRLGIRNDHSYTNTPRRNDQQRASSSYPSRYANSDQSGPSTYTYKSKKDWATIHSKKNDGVLASPAGDIKPMRSSKSKKLGLDKEGEDEFDFELVQSVSRSGGDGKQGDMLKDWEIQERYRVFIENKITKHHSTFNTTYHKAPQSEARDEIESLGSIVLLFRKLREGVVASGRIDLFAIEVFQSSARFSILANNRPQLISSLSGLVPGLHNALDEQKGQREVDHTSRSKFHAQSGADLTQQLKDLNIHQEEKKERRKEFVILFLLYQLVIIGENEFWSNYQQLTQPLEKKRLRRHFDDISNTSTTNDSQIQDQSKRNNTTESPFISPSSITLAVNIARTISPDRFDPIRYFQITNTRTTEYEKVILSWGEDKIRQRAWEELRKAYMTCSIGWAGKFLGLDEGEVERWVDERGGKVEGGMVRLR
ncbi:uncharacterized protein L199_003159 [Kwoniella botswanensis]|uniref:uncharacterized protein n=1 Tax=Kwoniella botswanensis TaxID=1268659 RepID=UPI00315D26FF